MQDTTYVRFFCELEELDKVAEELIDLGNDFTKTDEHLAGDLHMVIGGKINTEALTVLALKSEYLSKRLTTSYIPSHLKDRYRR